MNLGEDEIEQIKLRISEMEAEHRDLDDAIARVQEQAFIDQLQMQRMKKRKLHLKDSIHRLHSMLIPDMPA